MLTAYCEGFRTRFQSISDINLATLKECPNNSRSAVRIESDQCPNQIGILVLIVSQYAALSLAAEPPSR